MNVLYFADSLLPMFFGLHIRDDHAHHHKMSRSKNIQKSRIFILGKENPLRNLSLLTIHSRYEKHSSILS